MNEVGKELKKYYKEILREMKEWEHRKKELYKPSKQEYIENNLNR